MKVYLLPGLGFDHRIYRGYEFDDIDIEYLDWIDPIVDESIQDYSRRLSIKIPKDSKDIILIGHSLGGIVAQEIAAIQSIKKIFLISSIRSRSELPFHFKIVKPLYVHKLFSKELTAKTIKYWGGMHDYISSEEKALVKDMVSQQSNNYLQWALRQLSIWKRPNISDDTEIFQIVGATDQTFPIKLIKQPDRVIENSGHFMVHKQSRVINDIIADELGC